MSVFGGWVGTSAICICALSIYIYLYVKYCVVVIKASMPVVCGVKGVGGYICHRYMWIVYIYICKACMLAWFFWGEGYIWELIWVLHIISWLFQMGSHWLHGAAKMSPHLTGSFIWGVSESLSGYFILYLDCFKWALINYIDHRRCGTGTFKWGF